MHNDVGVRLSLSLYSFIALALVAYWSKIGREASGEGVFTLQCAQILAHLYQHHSSNLGNVSTVSRIFKKCLMRHLTECQNTFTFEETLEGGMH